MAFPVATLNSTTMRYIVPKIWDNVFKSNALLVRLVKRAKGFDATDGTIRYPVILTQNPNAQSYAPGGTLSTTSSENTTAGELAVAYYNSAISLPGPDVILNMGKNQVINLLKDEFYVAEKSLKDLMGSDAFGSNNGAATGLVGLQPAIDDSTNFTTYAGISRSAYPTWKAQYTDLASAAINLGNLESSYINSSIDASFVTLIVTTYAGVIKLWNIIQPQQRFTASDDLWIIGARNMAFGNAPIVADPHCPANQVYFLNTNYLHLYANLNRNFAFIPFQLPTNQDQYIAHIRWYGQLICESPRLQARIVNAGF
jgi:hypothetical protein